MASATLPDTHADLLERNLFAHLATVRPDGSAQSSVMWFAWGGECVRFTHVTTRQKYKNFQHEPRIALSVHDPDDPYRFLEVRAVVESLAPDVDAAFFKSLQDSYGVHEPVTDADRRVVVVARATSFVAVTRGRIDRGA